MECFNIKIIVKYKFSQSSQTNCTRLNNQIFRQTLSRCILPRNVSICVRVLVKFEFSYKFVQIKYDKKSKIVGTNCTRPNSQIFDRTLLRYTLPRNILMQKPSSNVFKPGLTSFHGKFSNFHNARCPGLMKRRVQSATVCTVTKGKSVQARSSTGNTVPRIPTGFQIAS